MLKPSDLFKPDDGAAPSVQTFTQSQLDSAVLLVRDATRVEMCVANLVEELRRSRRPEAEVIQSLAEHLSVALDRLPPAEFDRIRQRLGAMAPELGGILQTTPLPDRLRVATAASLSYCQIHGQARGARL